MPPRRLPVRRRPRLPGPLWRSAGRGGEALPPSSHWRFRRRGSRRRGRRRAHPRRRAADRAPRPPSRPPPRPLSQSDRRAQRPRARFVVGAASYWNFPTFAAGATTRTFTSASSFCSATALRTSSFGTRSSAMSSTFRELMPLVCHLEGRETTLSSLLGPVREDAAPRVLRSPDSGPQALELDDLAVIDEEVDAGPVLLHVPAEDFRFGRFEHHSL